MGKILCTLDERQQQNVKLQLTRDVGKILCTIDGRRLIIGKPQQMTDND